MEAIEDRRAFRITQQIQRTGARQFFAPANAQSSATLLFLGFVIAAAVWGAITSSKGILLKQGLPALLAFAATAAYVFQANA